MPRWSLRVAFLFFSSSSVVTPPRHPSTDSFLANKTSVLPFLPQPARQSVSHRAPQCGNERKETHSALANEKLPSAPSSFEMVIFHPMNCSATHSLCVRRLFHCRAFPCISLFSAYILMSITNDYLLPSHAGQRRLTYLWGNSVLQLFFLPQSDFSRRFNLNLQCTFERVFVLASHIPHVSPSHCCETRLH